MSLYFRVYMAVPLTDRPALTMIARLQNIAKRKKLLSQKGTSHIQI